MPERERDADGEFYYAHLKETREERVKDTIERVNRAIEEVDAILDDALSDAEPRAFGG